MVDTRYKPYFIKIRLWKHIKKTAILLPTLICKENNSKD